jgi:hypothetical protein
VHAGWRRNSPQASAHALAAHAFALLTCRPRTRAAEGVFGAAAWRASEHCKRTWLQTVSSTGASAGRRVRLPAQRCAALGRTFCARACIHCVYRLLQCARPRRAAAATLQLSECAPLQEGGTVPACCEEFLCLSGTRPRLERYHDRARAAVRSQGHDARRCERASCAPFAASKGLSGATTFVWLLRCRHSASRRERAATAYTTPRPRGGGS